MAVSSVDLVELKQKCQYLLVTWYVIHGRLVISGRNKQYRQDPRVETPCSQAAANF